MTDYTKPTGYGGLMMIRDLGSIVELWIKSGSNNNQNVNVDFNWTANSQSNSGSFVYPLNSTSWLLVKSITVDTTQTIVFGISPTYTMPIGGPSKFSQLINRTRPTPPSQFHLYNVKSTSVAPYMSGPFTFGATGSSGVTTYYARLDPTGLEWEIGYGTNPATPEFTIAYAGIQSTNAITGLIPGTTYYFWARGRNEVGWGVYSTRVSVKTTPVARVMIDGVWQEAIPYVKIGGVWEHALPWVKNAGTWKETL